jgi:DNA-binding CsgD family transcriptional regulator/tetratricopeptide (TPR) repeat protein
LNGGFCIVADPSGLESPGRAEQDRGMLTVQLLERDELLGRLGAELDRGGRLLFVGGEAGVGKTSLVRVFCAASPVPVVQGACESLTTPSPLGPFVDVGREIGGVVASRVAASAPPREIALALVESLARPTIVVLEDVHWADEATLDVLRVLARRIEATASLVLATYRDDEVGDDHPLRVLLGELASAPGVSRCSVPPLTLDGVRTLAEPTGADADALYGLTRGNPFYVTEALAGGGELLPTTVRDAVLARVSARGTEARRLLEVVALVPGRAPLRLLEAVAPDELDQLDVWLSSGMLREDAGAVAFRHELARLAVESSVPPQRRRALHAAIVTTLAAEQEVDHAKVAHHAEATGDERRALEHSVAAGRQSSRSGAHREAFAQFARALRYVRGEERASLLAAYAHEAHVTGRQEDAIAARVEAASLCRGRGDAIGEGENLARVSLSYIALGRNFEAEEACRFGIDVLERLAPTTQLATAYSHQSYLRMLARDNLEAVEWGRKAAALAERFDDVDTLAMALNMTGTAYVVAGEIELGCGYLEKSLSLAREHEIDTRVASALSMLGTALGEMYELASAERFLREHIAYADEHDLDAWYTHSWLALALVYEGRWEEGTTVAQAVLDSPAAAISRIMALLAIARVRARRGDPGVVGLLDEALDVSRVGGHLQRLGPVHAARAEAAWLVGDREHVLEEAGAVYELALGKRHPWFAGELAYWQWKAGRAVAAPDWVAEPYRLQLAGAAADAAGAWRARGCPYEAARALAESGEEADLLEALAEFERLGAEPDLRAVRQSLRAHGYSVPRGPRAATRANPGELTMREIEVLRLVAEGLRNVDVAERLVLSRRTVDHHVSAIFRKLNVRSRGQAAAAAARLGLLEDR